MLDHVFFSKQKTAYEMRISDWSSDVCASDLLQERREPRPPVQDAARRSRRLRISNTQPASNTPDKAAPTSITAADAVTMPSLRMTFSTERSEDPREVKGVGSQGRFRWTPSYSYK